MLSKSIRVLIFTLAALASSAVWAQAPSSKVLRIVVGFPPGQAVDIVARLLAKKISPALGQNVIVENRPGQGGSLALAAMAKSPADGTAVTLSALASLVTNPHLYKNVQYDTLKDFEPIGLVADIPLVFVANTAIPGKSFDDIVAYARANPSKLFHPSSGNGTVSHLAMEDFKRRAGLKIGHVPYQGSVKAMTDLVAGNVHVAMDTVAVTRAYIQSGRLNLLAVGSAKRLPVFPDTPTIGELGYSGFEANAWIGLLAPAGSPADWVAHLNDEVVKVVRSAEFEQRLVAFGQQPRPSSPMEFKRFLKAEFERWGELVRASGAKVD